MKIRSALFVVKKGALLLAAHEKGGRRYYLLPGGGVDPGEDWARAAERELHEELGCRAEAGVLLGVYENRSPDGARHLLHAIFAGAIAGEPRVTGRDDRVVGHRWVRADELDEVEIRPALADRFGRWLREGLPAGGEYARLPWVE